LPRAQATVPLGQKDDPPANEGVTPSMQPPARTAAGPRQHADSDAPPDQRSSQGSSSASDGPATNTHVGVGYKIGNGIGFLGADAILSPVPHLALDLQVSVFSVAAAGGTANGVGWAPMLQLYFNDPGRSTLYVGVGWIHASASLQNVNASVNGFAANVGYEWKWQSGFGLLLGGGVAILGDATATNGSTTVSIGGGAHPNLELGFRFMLI
jgi:hypothetical protein